MNWTLFGSILGVSLIFSGTLLKIFGNRSLRYSVTDHEKRIIILEENRKASNVKIDDIQEKVDKIYDFLMRKPNEK